MTPADDLWAALALSGQFRRLAPPHWARAQLSAQIQRIGATALEASSPKEKQPQELEAAQLEDMEPEP